MAEAYKAVTVLTYTRLYRGIGLECFEEEMLFVDVCGCHNCEDIALCVNVKKKCCDATRLCTSRNLWGPPRTLINISLMSL